MRSWRLARAVLLPLALAGCAVGPVFHTPQTKVPARFSVAARTRPAWPKPGWWHGFGSPELDTLIGAARTHNFSVIEAIDQIEAANAQVRIAGAPLLPSLSGTGGASVRQSQAGLPGGGTKTIDTRDFTAAFQASYQLDFWGKNGDALRAAQASAAAARFNAATVALSAEAAVATTYFQMLAYQDQLAIAKRNLKAAEELLAQLRAQFRAGIVDQPTVEQQAALVAAERATVPNLTSQMRQQAIGLGILTGQAPEFLSVKGGSLGAITVPALSPGLPSDLLKRRPDIAEAEANLIAANANVRGAVAAFFPSITLTGSAGWESTALHLLFAPGSVLLSAAGSLAQPLFEGGALTGQLAVSRATYKEDVARYEQAVVQAFTDVDTAMTALHYATDQERLQADAVHRARTALAGAKAQLGAGVVDISTVLNAEQTLLSDENTLVNARLTRLDAAVNLYKAMGGGWIHGHGDLEQGDPAGSRDR